MVLVSGRWVSLLDWRGFEANDTKAISGAGGWIGGGGGCLRGSVARAEEYSCRGVSVEHRVSCGFRAEDAISYGGAGADCDCVVPVPGFHRGARGKGWRWRKVGAERVRGACQREIQYQED